MLNYCVFKAVYIIISLVVAVLMLEEIQNGIRTVDSDSRIGHTFSNRGGFLSDDTNGDGGNWTAFLNGNISSRNAYI